MATINFDKVINRKGTSSLKWDLTEERYGAKDLLPMWVADMDFPSPPEVTDALIERAKHPVYGYTGVDSDVYTAVMDWMKNKHDYTIKKEWITFSPGVVSGFTSAILALSEPGDKILIQTPVYTPFFDSIKKNDRVVVENPLRYQDGRMRIDFDDLENRLKDGIKLLLLCSPHNPGGMVWRKEELERVGELCIRYGVLILSDEIHADLCLPGHIHYPIASLSKDIADITVTFIAPSKTFNVAGIQASIILTQNKEIRTKISELQHQIGFHGLNLFALEAIKASYRHGYEWLEELTAYLQGHVETVKTFIETELPHIKMYEPEASYLVWLDCSSLGLTDSELQKRLIEKGKIAISPGVMYGSGGEGFIRLNIGCTSDVLKEGLHRLKAALSTD